MECLKRVRKRAHRCFELAARAVISGDPEAVGAKLVHGVIYAKTGSLAHAWVQLEDGRVYDTTQNRYYQTMREYERMCGAIIERVYTKAETSSLIFAHKHWGAWHDSAGVSFDYGPPLGVGNGVGLNHCPEINSGRQDL